MQALDRLREQQAQRLLDALQSDLRAQIRQENEEIGRRGQHKPICTEQERLQLKIARLADAKAREHLWTQVIVPKYQDVPVNDLPKTREFWAAIDLTSWSKNQLDTACALLDLPQGGKKAELIARIQDWVHSFEIREQQEEVDRKERMREEELASGRVFACGSNFHGELGLGDRRERVVPTELESLRGQHITNVVSGFDSNFAFALTADHRVFVWGGGGKTVMDIKENSSPPFSHPTKAFTFRMQHVQSSNDTNSSGSMLASTCFLLPHLVSAFADKRVSSIACGRSEGHLSFTTTEGTCFTWGRNDYGELGVEYPVGDSQEPADVSRTTASPVTVKMSNLNGDTRITQVSVGNCHSAAITQNGELYVWGACWSGQLGLGVTKRIGVKDRRKQLYFPAPTLVESFGRRKRVSKVSCGAVHTAVITAESRQLYTFGCGDGGRLGLGSNTDAIHPTLVTALERDVVLDVVCCSWHSIALVQPRDCGDLDTSEGFVYAFGNGLHGQLGLGKQKIAALPTRLAELHHRRVRCRAIAASSYHSCALSSDGKLFTWGQNASGCLGRVIADGSIDSAEPDVIANFSDYGVGPIISIACGHRFTVFATGPWVPLEREPQFEINERLNRHPKFKSPKFIQGRKKTSKLIHHN